jgi:hypothetical protein
MGTVKATKKKSTGKKWFSRILPTDKKNAGLTISQKRRKAEDACKKLLKAHPKGRIWEISSFEWRDHLTVRLKKKPGPIPPGESTIPPVPKPPLM